MIAWDDTKKETIPFGDNRRVAKIRKEWMRRNDKLDSKDLNLHRGDDDVNVAPAGVFNEQNQADYERRRDAGSDVWLKYVLFDSKIIRKLMNGSCGKYLTQFLSQNLLISSIRRRQ